MKTAHPSEGEIQQYVLENETCPEETKGHILSCEHCSNEVALYRTLFLQIESQAAPELGFDLATSVVNQIHALPKRKSSPLYPILATTIAALGILGLTIWLLNDKLLSLLGHLDTSQLLNYTLISAAALIIGFQLTESIRNHKAQLKKYRLD